MIAAAMGKVEIKIPFVTWRDGRPRFIPGAAARRLGFSGEDLRHGRDGPWFTLDEAIAWSKARQSEIAERRRGGAARAPSGAKARGAGGARASRLVTLGQVCHAFDASARMAGREVVEGRRRRAPLSANTIRFYRGAMRLIEGFDGGRVWNEAADAVTPRALTGILEKIEIRHGLAQARAARAYLSVAYAHGRRAGMTAHNPVEGIEETLPVLEPRVRPATVAEIAALVAAADALGLPDFADLVVAGVWTGQRQNDRLQLTADAVTADGILFAPSKKKKAAQRLLIPAAGALSHRIEGARRRRRAWPATPVTLFACEATRRPWAADWYRKVFRVVRHAVATGRVETDAAGAPSKDARAILGETDVAGALAAAGVPALASIGDLRDQDLRDTCLSWLALAGADRLEIAGFSGHAFGQSDKVLRHYVAVPPEFARRGMARLEAWHAAQVAALDAAAGEKEIGL